jgi:RNA polymerase sigma-70 factor (ECF subfamily)
MTVPGGGYDADLAAHSIAEAVARRSYGKLVALLAMRTRDVAAAEDALADAFAAARRFLQRKCAALSRTTR